MPPRANRHRQPRTVVTEQSSSAAIRAFIRCWPASSTILACGTCDARTNARPCRARGRDRIPRLHRASCQHWSMAPAHFAAPPAKLAGRQYRRQGRCKASRVWPANEHRKRLYRSSRLRKSVTHALPIAVYQDDNWASWVGRGGTAPRSGGCRPPCARGCCGRQAAHAVCVRYRH